jgi:hypothetical protein
VANKTREVIEKLLKAVRHLESTTSARTGLVVLVVLAWLSTSGVVVSLGYLAARGDLSKPLLLAFSIGILALLIYISTQVVGLSGLPALGLSAPSRALVGTLGTERDAVGKRGLALQDRCLQPLGHHAREGRLFRTTGAGSGQPHASLVPPIQAIPALISGMANKRNIAALVQALRGSPGLPAGIPLEALADHLAEAGVLVPAALTDDQAVAIGADAAGTLPTERTEIALCVREGLEQIAKGAR